MGRVMFIGFGCSTRRLEPNVCVYVSLNTVLIGLTMKNEVYQVLIVGIEEVVEYHVLVRSIGKCSAKF